MMMSLHPIAAEHVIDVRRIVIGGNECMQQLNSEQLPNSSVEASE